MEALSAAEGLTQARTKTGQAKRHKKEEVPPWYTGREGRKLTGHIIQLDLVLDGGPNT